MFMYRFFLCRCVCSSKYLPNKSACPFGQHLAHLCEQTTILTDVCCRREGVTLRNMFGPGVGPILMENIRCTGLEARLEDCRHNGWGWHNCTHSKDVSIRCLSDSGRNIIITTTTRRPELGTSSLVKRHFNVMSFQLMKLYPK